VDVAIVIPAKNESDRIQATVKAAAGLPGADMLIVVDDGSADDTGFVAENAGAIVLRHARSRGKGAALETGAEAVGLLERSEERELPRHLLFLDADLAESAAHAAPLVQPVRDGQADMTIAGVQRAGPGGRARFRGGAVRVGYPPRHRLASGPAAQRAALPHPGRVRGRPAAGPGLGRGNGNDYRPGSAWACG